MKKIAFALEKFSRYAGGAESYAVSLATTLIENGWEVHLFGEAWDGEPKEAHFHEIYIPRFLPSWIKMLLFAWKHKKMTEKQHYDVVMGFGNTIYMNVYQSHGGVHQLSTARKVYAENNVIRRIVKRISILLSMKQWVRAWIESAPFRLNPRPKIVAIAHMIKKDMESFFHTNADEIEIIYNGVDTERYNSSLRQRMRGQLRAQWGVSENDIVFLFVSYDLKKKGIEPLVEAAAKLKRTGNENFKGPDAWIPRTGNIFEDFIGAIKSGKKSCNDFSISSKLTEIMLLTNIAVKHQLDAITLEYDAANMKITNLPEANSMFQYDYRTGWTL